MAAGPSVVAGDTASVALKMFSNEGDQYINSLGSVSVKRGQAPVSIGENVTQQTFGGTKPQIMASSEQVPSGRIRAPSF